jgi:hypothetical protein
MQKHRTSCTVRVVWQAKHCPLLYNRNIVLEGKQLKFVFPEDREALVVTIHSLLGSAIGRI